MNRLIHCWILTMCLSNKERRRNIGSCVVSVVLGSIPRISVNQSNLTKQETEIMSKEKQEYFMRLCKECHGIFGSYLGKETTCVICKEEDND